MLLALAIILGLAWVWGFAIFHVTAFAIHLLVILAVISFAGHVLRRGPGTT